MMLDEHILRLLSRHGPMLKRQLAANLDAHRASIARACHGLQKHDLIKIPGSGQISITAAGRKLLEAGGPFPCQRKGKGAPSAGRTLRQRAWSVMRMADHFTTDSLLQIVSDGDSAGEEDNIKTYCRILYRAGFLGKTARTHAYFLRREADTGPLAPAYNSEEYCVTDRNTGKVYSLRHGNE